MGFKAVQAAFKVRTPSLASKLVLWALAEHYNERNALCFPSQERIAEETGLNKSSVKRAISELEGAGLVSKRRGIRRGSRNASYRYRLDFYIQARVEARRARISGYQVFAPKPDEGAAHPQQGISPPSKNLGGESSAPKAPKRRSQRAAPKLRMTWEWKPSTKALQHAISKGLTEDEATAAAEDFKLFWISHGEPRADWTAAWYRWASKQVAMKENDHGKTGIAGPGARGKHREDGIRMFVEAGAALRAERERREGGDG